MTMRYVHTLLFSCPNCKLPIAAARISKDESLEPVDGERQKLICLYCEESADIIATDVKMHWVDKWPFENLP
jgi:hypothetical protein